MKRDHDELDRTLFVMIEPTTPERELATRVDAFRLALAIHLVAEARVLATLITLVRPPPRVRAQIAELGTEHATQRSMAERLAGLVPGCDDWCNCVLELRVLVLDHAKHEQTLGAALDRYVPASIGRGLVAQYEAERMRLLAATPPRAHARSRAA